MNDQCAKTPKVGTDFEQILERFGYLSDTRNKFIIQIEDHLDRLRNNRTPSETPKFVEPENCIIGRLGAFLHDMDYSNERLAGICKRLEELV